MDQEMYEKMRYACEAFVDDFLTYCQECGLTNGETMTMLAMASNMLIIAYELIDQEVEGDEVSEVQEPEDEGDQHEDGVQ